MAKNSYVGVEAGSGRLKIAETRNGTVVRFAAEDMPDDMVRNGEIVQWEALGDFLKDSLKKNGISGKRGAVVVPDSLAFTRRVRMPAMSAAQLEVNLPYEFHDFISDDKEKYIYDYAMVGLLKDEDGVVREMDLLGAACSRELMDNYNQMFRRAGLKLAVAAPDSRASGNIFRKIAPQHTDEDFALLDLGASATRIDIYSRGIYSVTRSIEAGTSAVAGAIAELAGCDRHIGELYMREDREHVLESETCRDIYGGIAIDVMRAVNYYTFENPDNSLETLYYYGGGSHIAPLLSDIRETIPLEMKPLAALAEDPLLQTALMNGPAAVGICWNGE